MSYAIPALASRLPFGRRHWFLATIFTSAFLLFLVQPMIARIALPRLGGAPSVWNSAMLVYQALLLAGYAYAHALGRLAPRTQATLHLLLLALAAISLPIGLLPWSPPADANGFLWVPWLFLLSIGPLFFVVSAHAPLLQRWYDLSGCGDPYPLYAASNFGSFLGLISYPILVEPLVAVDAQSLGWSWAYALLLLLVAGCAVRLPQAVPRPAEASSDAPGWKRMAFWALLAAVPSGLIMSTTLHLTTDIVAMPLLWVMPLGLYLLSFSLAFAEKRGAAKAATRGAPIALLICACGAAGDTVPYPMVMLAAALVGLFLLSVALHARLFDDRPPPDQLTRFYLVMSIGGALGGLFTALVAPTIFDWTYEHPILLLAAGLLLPLANPFAKVAAIWASPLAARFELVLALIVIAAMALAVAVPSALLVSLLALVLVGVVAIGCRRLFVFTLAAVMLVGGGLDKLGLSLSPGKMTRSFFGIYAVRDNGNGSRQLVHGTTAHGIQNRGSEARERMATAYYSPRSGVGQAMIAKDQLYPAARVAVVGLGTGTLACYARPGEQWTFYEIDPEIVSIARDPKRFTFLSRCKPDARMVVGDARLTLGQEEAAGADILVIDAFSSDSVPMHLLTREAFDLYRRKLAPNGLLLVHISNRYLQLEPVIEAAARKGWAGLVRIHLPTAAEKRDHAYASQWVALSRDPLALVVLGAQGEENDWRELRRRPDFEPWTDNRSSILPLIRWRP